MATKKLPRKPTRDRKALAFLDRYENRVFDALQEQLDEQPAQVRRAAAHFDEESREQNSNQVSPRRA